MAEERQSTEPNKPEQDSELKQNLVAAGKIGGFMLGALALLFLYVLIVMMTSLGK